MSVIREVLSTGSRSYLHLQIGSSPRDLTGLGERSPRRGAAAVPGAGNLPCAPGLPVLCLFQAGGQMGRRTPAGSQPLPHTRVRASRAPAGLTQRSALITNLMSC